MRYLRRQPNQARLCSKSGVVGVSFCSRFMQKTSMYMKGSLFKEGRTAKKIGRTAQGQFQEDIEVGRGNCALERRVSI